MIRFFRIRTNWGTSWEEKSCQKMHLLSSFLLPPPHLKYRPKNKSLIWKQVSLQILPQSPACTFINYVTQLHYGMTGSGKAATRAPYCIFKTLKSTRPWQATPKGKYQFKELSTSQNGEPPLIKMVLFQDSLWGLYYVRSWFILVHTSM